MMELSVHNLVTFLRNRSESDIYNQYDRYLLGECADRLEAMQNELNQYAAIIKEVNKAFNQLIKSEVRR